VHYVSFRQSAFMAMVLGSGAALMPRLAEAATLSKADKVALKQAITACKAEVKGKRGSQGPSQHRPHSIAQEPSGFDGSPGGAMARVLGKERIYEVGTSDPRTFIATLARLVEAGEPMFGACQQFRRIRSGAEPGDPVLLLTARPVPTR
jgi:hypothetical protein